MPPKNRSKRPSAALAQFKILIVCRGPIAMEAMEVARGLDMPLPDLLVSKREVFESADGLAPWSEFTDLYDRLHIVDDYKDQEAIVRIARRRGLDGVYVGYGYSAEDAEFIARLEAASIVPIAPPSQVMAFSGSKFRAKRRVRDELGIPVLPGSDGAAELAQMGDASDSDLLQAVQAEVEKTLRDAPDQVIRLKAAKSGGGKGQRLISEVSQAASAVQEIWSEISARGVDGDKGILVEANLAHPRHWEIQVLSDGETAVHFGGRECSIQNSGSQKFIELSLHPGQYDHYIASLDETRHADLIGQLRDEQARIRETFSFAVRIIQSLGYRGAATVEFLVAEEGGAEIRGKPHFMEINSRIQVEHRVSEAISRVRGEPVRLVGEQLRIAAGEKLGYSQDDITFEGYAIETRINASDSNFLIGASGSLIEEYRLPPRGKEFYYDDGGAARLFEEGRRRRWKLPNFDSNFGLAVFWGATQDEAYERAERGLQAFEIRGNAQLRTTRPFHLGVLALLRASAPYAKVRTDFSEIFLAFGAAIHPALAAIEDSTLEGAGPARRLLAAALHAFQRDPALAIAFGFRERRLAGSMEKNGSVAPDLLAYLSDLVQCPLFAEERAAIEAMRDGYPQIVERVLRAVESSGIYSFARHKEDLDFDIPESVSQPRERRLLIEELRDTSTQTLAERTLLARELKDLKHLFHTLRNKVAEHVEDVGCLSSVNRALDACLERLGSLAELPASHFHAFYDDLRRVKWAIRKAPIEPGVETVLMREVNRAVRFVRGPAVVTPLAGTIFLSPAPSEPPFVSVGDEVIEDETVVALLENMKMFNEIRAHMSGQIKEILVENERPVLPGDVIMVIE